MSTLRGPTLTPVAARWRVVYLIALAAVLVGLALVPPKTFPQTWIFPTSCGAVTGLPCIFCGTTRALHYLLQGDLGRALYFNWLAYPLLLAALLLALTTFLELVCARNLLARLPRPRLTRTLLGSLAVGFVGLWVLQVYLAVSQHKSELLNPDGPLYSLVVR